jgi:pyrimidine oxygenase
MGLWPGDEHFRSRYKVLDEYAHILRELWETGVSDFKGQYYTMDDCRVLPTPQADMKIICAGSSDEGLAFSAKWADYAFCLGKGVNTPPPSPSTTTASPKLWNSPGATCRSSS